jgi:glutamyl-Q tRNA(Asp) synthetase
VPPVTRFAPSPTGPLHLGHAYSAILAHDRAHARGGSFILRIEDTDRARARPEWEERIFEDLAWLGLDWPRPVLRQSERREAHLAAIDALSARGLVYPCSCRRADIRAALSAPQEGEGPPAGPDGPIYPGTCRGRDIADRQPGDALRLDMRKAVQNIAFPMYFTESGTAFQGVHGISAPALVEQVGDIVLGRRDTGDIAYHLAVVVDDGFQSVTEVTRGQDLFEATHLHVALQRLLGLPTPSYHHHLLIRDAAGKRLAKRDDARAIARYRADGSTPQDIRRMVGLD